MARSHSYDSKASNGQTEHPLTVKPRRRHDRSMLQYEVTRDFGSGVLFATLFRANFLTLIRELIGVGQLGVTTDSQRPTVL